MLPALFVVLSLAASPDTPPVRPVAAVDLERYLGKWYEIARYPNRFQKGCAGDVTAQYALKKDGRLSVVNRCRRADGSLNEAEGEARVVDGSSNARLKVRFAPGWIGFLPFVWGDYWVLGLHADYRWAVVGASDWLYAGGASGRREGRDGRRDAGLRRGELALLQRPQRRGQGALREDRHGTELDALRLHRGRSGAGENSLTPNSQSGLLFALSR